MSNLIDVKPLSEKDSEKIRKLKKSELIIQFLRRK